jgi:hypothetical protein
MSCWTNRPASRRQLALDPLLAQHQNVSWLQRIRKSQILEFKETFPHWWLSWVEITATCWMYKCNDVWVQESEWQPCNHAHPVTTFIVWSQALVKGLINGHTCYFSSNVDFETYLGNIQRSLSPWESCTRQIFLSLSAVLLIHLLTHLTNVY